MTYTIYHMTPNIDHATSNIYPISYNIEYNK